MVKQSNIEALKAMGYEEPKCNVADLYDTPDNNKIKAKILPIFSVIGRFFCKIGLHNWKFSHDTGINEYYECKRCKKREVRYCHLYGYQPIDRDWLNAL